MLTRKFVGKSFGLSQLPDDLTIRLNPKVDLDLNKRQLPLDFTEDHVDIGARVEQWELILDEPLVSFELFVEASCQYLAWDHPD